MFAGLVLCYTTSRRGQVPKRFDVRFGLDLVRPNTECRIPLFRIQFHFNYFNKPQNIDFDYMQ